MSMAGPYQSLEIRRSFGAPIMLDLSNDDVTSIQLENGFLVLEYKTRTVGYSSHTIDTFEIVYKQDG